jgi:hypothetical protein
MDMAESCSEAEDSEQDEEVAAAAVPGGQPDPEAGFKSQYRGVSYDRKKRRWRVQIKVRLLRSAGRELLLRHVPAALQPRPCALTARALRAAAYRTPQRACRPYTPTPTPPRTPHRNRWQPWASRAFRWATLTASWRQRGPTTAPPSACWACRAASPPSTSPPTTTPAPPSQTCRARPGRRSRRCSRTAGARWARGPPAGSRPGSCGRPDGGAGAGHTGASAAVLAPGRAALQQRPRPWPQPRPQPQAQPGRRPGASQSTCVAPAQVPRRRPNHPKRTSNYLGVGSNNRKDQWQARIMYLGKATHLGYYPSEQDAARAYDRCATAAAWTGQRWLGTSSRGPEGPVWSRGRAELAARSGTTWQPRPCRVAIALQGQAAQTNFPASEYEQQGGGGSLQVRACCRLGRCCSGGTWRPLSPGPGVRPSAGRLGKPGLTLDPAACHLGGEKGDDPQHGRR